MRSTNVRAVRAETLARVMLTLAALGCGNAPTPSTPDGGPLDGSVLRCSSADDADGDLVSTEDEGTGDPDGDGVPNALDPDSDSDGRSDRDEAGDLSCATPPIDTDRDGVPDLLDLDSNGDGRNDADQLESDVDGDHVIDVIDLDVDGDGIANAIEVGDPVSPVDTDHDGTPDVFDLDSDGDTISDAHEGALDADGDATPAFRDLDSDGDGVDDAIEAGDTDLLTPPVSCAAEVDPVTGDVESDHVADVADTDSDNDGLGDGEENVLGTDRCSLDSDGDGTPDVFEGAYVHVHCPDGPTAPGAEHCDCAANADCTIPDEDYYLVLPFGGPLVSRTLEFGTDIRSADVFFLLDTTGSMTGTLENAKSTVTEPVTGLVDRIRDTIPDTWFGGGQHDDLPFATWGVPPNDVAFGLATTMTDDDDAVHAAIGAITLHSGIDPPEAQVVALHAIFTGEGGDYEYRGPIGGVQTYSLPSYGDACTDGRWGGPCFRAGALPIVVHFTDRCAHNGPPGEDLVHCPDYTGVTPELPTWNETVAAMNTHGARYVGVNAGATSCEGPTMPRADSACYLMRRTAEETRSVDLDGRALVYDLPNESSHEAFVDTIVSAIDTIARRVPFDVSTAVRAEPSPLADAARFVRSRTPGCEATPAIDPCWAPPPGVPANEAVAGTDLSTFYGVVPGTRVTFAIGFQNDFFEGTYQSELFVAHIEVRAGTAVLDEREVYVVVPARSGILD